MYILPLLSIIPSEHTSVTYIRAAMRTITYDAKNDFTQKENQFLYMDTVLEWKDIALPLSCIYGLS